MKKNIYSFLSNTKKFIVFLLLLNGLMKILKRMDIEEEIEELIKNIEMISKIIVSLIVCYIYYPGNTAYNLCNDDLNIAFLAGLLLLLDTLF